MLQWGRTFSSAESPFAKGKSALYETLLQWGRTFSSAERPAAQAGHERNLGRFNGAALFQVRKGEVWQAHAVSQKASFNGAALFQVRKEPTIFHSPGRRGRFNGAALFQVRKVPPSGLPRRFSKRLQWGRTFSSAESEEWRQCSPTGLGLQWGRTFSSAERITSQSQSQNHQNRFNGAALFQVRKVHLAFQSDNAG